LFNWINEVDCLVWVELVSKRQNQWIAILLINTSQNCFDWSLLVNFGTKKGHRPYVAIAFMNASLPMIFITRFMLYARICKLISVVTCALVFIKICEAPIQCFKVPNMCSIVHRRIFIASGMLSRFTCIWSSTASFSQRLTRLWLLMVQLDFNAHCLQLELQ